MKLRRKTLIISGLTIVSLVAILFATSQVILLDSFLKLEEQNTRQNVERAQSALSADLTNLDTLVFDWAAWDDTYDFIEDLNEDYIESNLLDETFIGYELNLMLFANSSGGIVFSKSFDLENQEEIPVPESFLEHLSPDDVLLQHLDTESSVAGIILLSEDPLLIASRPILTSEEEGPILGTLIMGYYLDSNQITSLAETTHLSLNMLRFDDSQMPSDFQTALSSLSEEGPIFVAPLNRESIAGYTLLDDIYGEPSLVLRVDMPRSIYIQGQITISYFILALLATGVVFGSVIMVLLEKIVLSRLAELSATVNGIRQCSDLSKRVSITGKDELSSLANEINGMLGTLEQSQSKVQSMNEKLHVVGKLTRHDVRNKLSAVTNNVYLAKRTLTGDQKAFEYLVDIGSACKEAERIFDFASTYEKLGVEELSYVDVEKSVEEAAKLLQELRNVKMVNSCSGLMVLADSLLRQLFYNLIDNSLKYGEKVNQIRVRYEEAGKNQLKLIYEDDGVGIPKAEKEMIFEEGYGKGTGYGLHLIRKICEVYGWTIRETGKQGKGAQFTITIPKMGAEGKTNYKLH